MQRLNRLPPNADGLIAVTCKDTSHYGRICKKLFDIIYDDPHSGVRQLYAEGENEQMILYTHPMMLHQTKIICTEKYWQPVWNFIVQEMHRDVERLGLFDIHDKNFHCRTTVEYWHDTLEDIARIRKELHFWMSKDLWSPYFIEIRAHDEVDIASRKMFYTAHSMVNSLQDCVTDYDIPKCLFIKHMHVAHILLRSIFRTNFNYEFEPLVCMILSHLYLLEHPFTFIHLLVPLEERNQFM